MSSDDFEISESGEIILEKLSDSFAPDLSRFIQSKSSNTTNSQNHNPSATVAAFNKAKENIKQQIIASDKSGDNTAALSAIAQFKNRHG